MNLVSFSDTAVNHLAEEFNGTIVEVPYARYGFKEKIVKINFNGHQYDLHPFADPWDSYSRFGFYTRSESAIQLSALIENNENLTFLVRYLRKRLSSFLLGTKLEFDNKSLKLTNEALIDQIIGLSNLINFISSIDFKFSPRFQLELSGNKLFMKIDKIGSSDDEWRKYLSFFDGIVQKIENYSVQS